MNKEIGLSLILMIITIFAVSAVLAADITVNITNASTAAKTKDARFIVQTLKYDPYPVNPGDSFDVWIKVQNTGEDDAPNAIFSLIPQYPFTSSENLVQEYGTISGRINAYKEQKLDEQSSQANQAIIKYRVKVAPDANQGENFLKFGVAIDKNSSQQIFKLPITISKTKTDFEVQVEESDFRRTVLTLTNNGDKIASAVTVSLKDDKSFSLTGDKSILVGNLKPGDILPITFNIQPIKTVNSLTLKIGYTDTTGNRISLDKIISLQLEPYIPPKTIQTKQDYSIWIYSGIGLAVGIILSLVLLRKDHKKKPAE